MSERVRHLIHLYSYSPLGMTPLSFYIKYPVTYEQIALICKCEPITVGRWFSERNLSQPTANDLRNLALADLLLEYYEEIPEVWLNRLCLNRNLW
jgi:hypothetical protein